ncbi:DUF3159 domain-containing protein [Candidatus Neomarinimicrobiota bacterium]
MSKIQEIREELIHVFSGRKLKIIDSIIPLVIFLALNQILGLNLATLFSLITSGIFLVYRLLTGDKLIFALVGALGVFAAAGIAYISGSDTGFFIPGLITGALTVLLCIGSVLIKKPIAAWSSRITRRWPKSWYMHEKVRSAYTEVTIAWAVAFGLRTLLEYWLLSQNAINAAGAVKIFLGWPYTILILILSYIYGSWRLTNLGGPSVEEYKERKLPPWEGQIRGF